MKLRPLHRWIATLSSAAGLVTILFGAVASILRQPPLSIPFWALTAALTAIVVTGLAGWMEHRRRMKLERLIHAKEMGELKKAVQLCRQRRQLSDQEIAALEARRKEIDLAIRRLRRRWL